MSIIPCSVRHLFRSNEYKDNTPFICQISVVHTDMCHTSWPRQAVQSAHISYVNSLTGPVL
jgi:hypothetical protein